MSIVKLAPAFKDYLWGGNKLKTDYGKKTNLEPLAESWEVSTHPDGESTIVSGDYKGLTLTDYIATKGNEVLGEVNKTFERFPVLIKFIDAKQDLSIQVHPDDAYALKYEGEYGKTEMWVILEAEPGAKIYYGTKTKLSKEDFLKAIDNDTILDVLKSVEVKQGDVIFVEAGTIHAIGAGIVICEIQQNSNTTYRVYDFNRKDTHGNLRELHINQAVAVSTLTPLDTNFLPQGKKIVADNYSLQELASCKYFTTTKLILNGSATFDVDQQSYEALVVLDGEVTLTGYHDTITLTKGESAFIDANTSNITLTGDVELLSIRT